VCFLEESGGAVTSIVGWDIGGVNVKAARLELGKGRTAQTRAASLPFEIWREKDRLTEVLRSVLATVASDHPPESMAVTMTAELSDIFATKREGVLFVLKSVRDCFPDLETYVFGLSGGFAPLSEAWTNPLDFAAANWLATAQWFAKQFPDCLLVDVGSTTTDIVPILDGRVSVSGRTDLERLASGELIYTGVLRTNLAAIVQSVPLGGRYCRVASEYFAISGDVNLILGKLNPQAYTCTTPDGQSPSIESARRRLARLVCADVEMLSPTAIDEIAAYIYDQQVRQIREGLAQVISRQPLLRGHPVIVLGAGAFLGIEAARSMELETKDLAGDWRREELIAAPCLAVAHLLAEHLKEGSR
jgi:(4-(4-[2-(gamma-L-glutamylamino)ethyl]phenoxymethyl)furan-2-yl)methanamine synthase